MKVYPLMIAGVMLLTAALADGGRSWKLLTHHYDGTSSIPNILTGTTAKLSALGC
jgi:hypothetical protein